MSAIPHLRSIIDLGCRKRPNIVHLLYDRLPVQCKQCGVRFTDDTLGKREMEDHLDMHFRQNRKANQNIGRGHSRSWFVDLHVRFFLLLRYQILIVFHRIGSTGVV
jgi:hypothetical protein